ncbi:hypothetical protein PL246_23450 [Salmonella enterica]|uniref:hypothetical protein n=1 Tax=Salmonella enterica TaxID=28901 RepID=UPI0018D145B6|nr:hypothetical protein [Salmonella enterica]EHO5066532.1 hypothetical protein [Salmonella enterica]EHO5107764.1 hypothetical protein [Salmonella enterica]EHO5923800.1 hypothetical protein [Salmonella enterica]MBH0368975.1 hypothetical protein [Salmonella enterica]MBH0487721.1 hypothetical protein [Salmonella enterica]
MKKAWGEFQETIVNVNDMAQPKDIFIIIRDWILKYNQLLLLDGVKEYSLYEYANININDYPIQYSSLKGDELKIFKKNITLPRRKSSDIGRVIRDALERLIIFEADRCCLQCGKYGLGVYEEPDLKKIVLECNQCGYAMYENKCPYNGGSRIVPATKTSLRTSGYI